MHYSIGEVSDITGIAASTLRYYDREGMFPTMERSSGGIRVFSDTELATLKVIECLKSSGMSIRDIKEFLGWCQEGDPSIGKRREMFHRRLAEVEAQIAGLERTRNMLRYKCWYYDTASEAGTEDARAGPPRRGHSGGPARLPHLNRATPVDPATPFGHPRGPSTRPDHKAHLTRHSRPTPDSDTSRP